MYHDTGAQKGSWDNSASFQCLLSSSETSYNQILFFKEKIITDIFKNHLHLNFLFFDEKGLSMRETYLKLSGMEAFHKSLNPCHIFRQTPHKDVIVIGARDFEEGFARGIAGVVKGLAV